MQPVPVRMPAVAGRFYPANPVRLATDLDGYLFPESSKRASAAVACLVPHAGYVYSGHVAGAVYRTLPACSTFVVIGPNHFGRGAPLALMGHGVWRTPLGDAVINRDLARMIQSHCAGMAEDAFAHAAEHSLEVQIPFLQRRMADFSFVPIAVASTEFHTLVELGHGVALALHEFAAPVIVIASSDLNHYEPDSVTRAKDAKAIERILAVDAQGLYDVVRKKNISMCGVGAAVATITAMKDLGATRAVLEKYATSADAGGQPEAVVGYAGIVVH